MHFKPIWTVDKEMADSKNSKSSLNILTGLSI